VHSRRLLLIRHAKAAAGGPDADRPLTDRGTRQAAAIGAWLGQAGLVPDRVLVSPAHRAAQTWQLVDAAAAAGPPALVDARIYDNTVEALLAVVRETPVGIGTVAVVGHNPSIAGLAAVLDDGRGSPEPRRAIDAGFGTGGVAVFAPATAFAEIAPGTATLIDFMRPGD
jgi:phosphohistidine phosphatase